MIPAPRTLEAAEARGYADLFRAAPPSLAAANGIAVREIGGVVCTAVARDDVNPRMFNHVIGFGIVAPATGALLDEIERFYADLGVGFCVCLSPGSEPAGDLFAARGYTPEYPWVKFWRAAEPPPPAETSLRIVEAGREHGEALGTIVAQGFGFPAFVCDWLAHVPGRSGWQCFVGLDGETPACAGALFVAGDAAWAAFGATLSAHRRRGGQSALFAARIGAAGRLGCSLVVTETGEQVEGRPSNSYRNILRAGFERAYLRPNLLSPGSVARAG